MDTRTGNQKLTNGVQTAELYNRVCTTPSQNWTQEEIDHIASVNGGWGYDQLEAVWQNPTTQTHNLSVSGGSGKIRYFGVASYMKQRSFLKPVTFDKYNIRLNITADVTKNLEVFTSFSLNNNKTGKPQQMELLVLTLMIHILNCVFGSPNNPFLRIVVN